MVEIEGKRGRELPLLLMPDIKEAMEILVKKRRGQHQLKRQVFLYPPLSEDSIHHIRHKDCLTKQCRGLN